MIGLPQIEINFKQDAITAIARSQRGIVAVVLQDDTDTSFDKVLYTREADIEASKFTEDNVKLLKRAFLGGPSKVWAVRLGVDQAFAEATSVLDLLDFDWLCYANQGEQQEVVSYVKGRNMANKNKQVKAVVAAVAADDIHIVNFANTGVTTMAGETLAAWQYLPRLTGFLAGLPFTRSSTYYVLDDLQAVTPVEKLDEAINSGKFCLFQDEEEVRVARGVNSLSTLASGVTEDMKKIAIIEAMDMIRKDIGAEFKNNYIGKYKNSYDNQCLFVSAVNSYFRQLAAEDVLDSNAENLAAVDVEAQRQAWIDRGKAEAVNWDDSTVKNNTLGSKVFLSGNIKILDAVEDLTFNIVIV